MTKVCSKCKLEKSGDAFHKRRKSKDGLHWNCKACVSKYLAERRLKPELHERLLQLERANYRRNRPQKLASAQRRNDAIRERKFPGRPNLRNLCKLNPQRQIARDILHEAVRYGRLAKPEHCGDCFQMVPKAKLHGHHEDYSKPLEVAWVCYDCHKRRHGGNFYLSVIPKAAGEAAKQPPPERP